MGLLRARKENYRIITERFGLEGDLKIMFFHGQGHFPLAQIAQSSWEERDTLDLNIHFPPSPKRAFFFPLRRVKGLGDSFLHQELRHAGSILIPRKALITSWQ